MITGKIVRAGSKVKVDGIELTCFVVECSGQDIMEIRSQGLYNHGVYVCKDRRGTNRANGPSFSRIKKVEEHENKQ